MLSALNASTRQLHSKIDGISDGVTKALHDLGEQLEAQEKKNKKKK
jgi:hypothetical protein